MSWQELDILAIKTEYPMGSAAIQSINLHVLSDRCGKVMKGASNNNVYLCMCMRPTCDKYAITTEKSSTYYMVINPENTTKLLQYHIFYPPFPPFPHLRKNTNWNKVTSRKFPNYHGKKFIDVIWRAFYSVCHTITIESKLPYLFERTLALRLSPPLIITLFSITSLPWIRFGRS